MCEDVGTRGGDGTAEAACFGIGGKGRGGLYQWFRWGTVDDKVGGGNKISYGELTSVCEEAEMR